MIDQYGNAIPDDLIALSCGTDRFEADDLKIITDARWYEVTHSHGQDLAVSFLEIQGLIEDSPLGDTPIDIAYVDDCLKRWNDIDGFYHA